MIIPDDLEESKKLAKRIMKPFMGFPAQPTEEETLRRCLLSLAQGARSEAHAIRVVDGLLKICKFFPLPADIGEACEYTPDDEQVSAARRYCKACDGTGYRIVQKNGVEGAVRCNHNSMEVCA